MINPGVQAVGAAQAGGAPQFASLYVGDLDVEVTEAMLYEIFNTVGPVASIRVCRDSVSRRSLGYAYVNFHSTADAERVMDTLNYSTIKGRCCRIMWSHRDPNLRKTGNGNVFVKNLDRNVDNKALYDTFSLFGNILSCKVAADQEGKSKGYGFVHYETAEAAKSAIEKVNGMQIGEKTVYVGEFLPRDGRTPAEVVNFTNIYVKNYPAEWDEEKLLTEFKKFGEITSSMCQKDKKNRPFAFLNYENAEDAANAIKEMHRADLRTDEEKAEAPHGRNAKGEPLDKPAETAPSADDAAGGEDGDSTGKTQQEKEEAIHPEHLLFVSRAMTKSEREQMLRAKFRSVSGNQPAGVNLYIKNLPDDCDDVGLRELFAPFGEITSARVMQDTNKRSKGFGFVCYKTPEEATKAVSDMHLKTIKGKPLYVGLAEKKDERTSRLAQRYKGEKGAAPMGVPGAMPQKGMPMGYDAKGQMGMGMKGGVMNGQQYYGMQMGGVQKGMMQQQQQMMGGMRPGVPGQMGAGFGMGGPGVGPGGPQQMAGPVGGAPGQMGGPGGAPGAPRPGMVGGMNPMQQQYQMMGKGMQMGMKGGFPQGGMMAQGGMPQGMQNMGGPGKGIPGMNGPGVGGPMGQQMAMAQMGRGGPIPSVPGQMPMQNGGAPQGAGGAGGGILTQQALANAPPGMQKQMLGEKLYPAVSRLQPDQAGKITGMMLEMDNTEVLMMLESEQQLRQKVDEAVRVLSQMK